MRELPIGKIRGLQQCASPRGIFSILALDHRNNLKKALNPKSPGQVTYGELAAFKEQVAAVLSPESSAVLLDPEYGLAHCVAAGAIPGAVGLIAALEATGYGEDETGGRISKLLPGWSVSTAKKMGANAVKLLVYYHPHSAMAESIEELIKQVAIECNKHDILFVLEPLTYSFAGKGKLAPGEKRELILETARRLTGIGGDVLKAEFPLDITAEPAESAWVSACAALTENSQVPWVLLSASVDFDIFLRQAAVACFNGASGVAVGRAIWREAASLNGLDRKAFLTEIALPRMRKITALCEALAVPVGSYFKAETISEGYYLDYR